MKDSVLIILLALVNSSVVGIVFMGFKNSWHNVTTYKKSYGLVFLYNINLITVHILEYVFLEKLIPIISLFLFRQLIVDFHKTLQKKISLTIKNIWFNVIPLVFLFFISIDILRGFANEVGVSGDINAYDFFMVVGVVLFQLSVFLEILFVNHKCRKDSIPRYRQVYLSHMLVNALFVFITLGVFITSQIESNILVSGLLFSLYLIFLSVNYIRSEWLPHAYTGKLVVHEEPTNKEKATRFRDRRSLDGLTGVFTREYFLNYIENLDTNDDALSVILIQISGLKLINESFGFEIGDDIVQKNSMIIGDLFPNATIARMTGSMFAIMTSRQDEDVINEKIRTIKDLSESNQSYKIHLYFGYYLRKNEDLSPLDIYLRAVEELYYHRVIINQKHQDQIADMLIDNQTMVSQDIAQHLKRCSEMGVEFARFLGLSNEVVMDVRNATLLHDVALVHLPKVHDYQVSFDNDFEKRVYKSHVSKGFDIAIESGINSLTARGILHHHECYNGSGFPHGLQGESIPLISQIIAIVDYVDMLFHTGKRPKTVKSHLLSKVGVAFSSEMVYNMIAFLEKEKMIEVKI